MLWSSSTTSRIDSMGMTPYLRTRPRKIVDFAPISLHMHPCAETREKEAEWPSS
jgi:hypothetical protein